MSRDQRAQDNWALLRASELAREHDVPLVVVFNLVPKFLDATERMFGFMLKGLKETEEALRGKGVPFYLLNGLPADTLPQYVRDMQPVAVVCDMSPLRVPMAWCTDVAKQLGDVPLYQVDAHNVVPVWVASDKQECGARTIRKKIQQKLPEFLTGFPPLPEQDKSWLDEFGGMPPNVDWAAVDRFLEIDRSVKEVSWIRPGACAARKALDKFCEERTLAQYIHRNDPLTCTQSGLSPWLHFGQLGPQRAALAVRAAGTGEAAAASEEFIEEAVVRRELSDNYCFYNPLYDQILGAALWAQETLKTHEKDKRQHLYTEEQLEQANTHDDLWNGAQNELRGAGKMHGFMRMYWTKKILEWTKTPEEALRIGNKLNDKYSLDGRDPNGYVGVAWSIMGAHDMGWTERPIFGKIRFMNYDGCKRKFKVREYEERWKKPRDEDPRSLGVKAGSTPGKVRASRGAQTAAGGNFNKRKLDDKIKEIDAGIEEEKRSRIKAAKSS